MKTSFKIGLLLAGVVAITTVGCKKEGPAGKDGIAGVNGKDGKDGKDGINGNVGPNGKDANETCKECHNPTMVDAKVVEYEFSKHSFGEAAFEESGNASCAPCHTNNGFKYVSKNNISTAFTLNTTTGKYVNGYSTGASVAFGEIGCFTCHSQIHTTYGKSDLPGLTNIAEVSMTMWGGAKSINLTQDGGKSNLCVKCHQPRPLTTSGPGGDGNVLDYAALAASPTAVFFDSTTANASKNKLVPGYRTHVHYGTVGAVFAGKGAVEFTGTESYSNSPHTTIASCQNCHMATITGRAGGHTFVAKGNFNGCNVSGCHSAAPLDANAPKFKDTRAAVKGLLEALGAKIQQGGVDILNTNADAEANLWASLTTKKYDGYLDVFDPTLNPDGKFRNMGSTSSYSAANKAINNSLPKLHLTNAQMGAIINFQFCLREFSLGIHNTNYVKALLKNSADVL